MPTWHIVAEDDAAGERVELELAFTTREKAEHHRDLMLQWVPLRFRISIEERRSEQTLH